MAQLLFLACRGRRDIQTAVSFLTTRVRAPDEDDWGKVRRVLQYLKGTLYLKLRLTVENLMGADSRIRDADLAVETSKLAQAQVLQEAGVAILSQANIIPRMALDLLKQ